MKQAKFYFWQFPVLGNWLPIFSNETNFIKKFFFFIYTQISLDWDQDHQTHHQSCFPSHQNLTHCFQIKKFQTYDFHFTFGLLPFFTDFGCLLLSKSFFNLDIVLCETWKFDSMNAYVQLGEFFMNWKTIWCLMWFSSVVLLFIGEWNEKERWSNNKMFIENYQSINFGRVKQNSNGWNLLKTKCRKSTSDEFPKIAVSSSWFQYN